MSEKTKAAQRLKEKLEAARLKTDFFETTNFEGIEVRVAAFYVGRPCPVCSTTTAYRGFGCPV